MKPRHFWWLVMDAQEKMKGPTMSEAEKDELLDMLERAQKGEF